MARKQLEAYERHKAERKPTRKIPERPPVMDCRATGLPSGVQPVEDFVDDVRFDEHRGVRWKLRVVRNTRSDTLAALKSRRMIDEHQYQAGRHWEALWERAEIGGIKAMDTTKEPVDGQGEAVEPLTDRQRSAVRDLRRADVDLGIRGAVLVRRILGRRETIEHIAAEYAGGSHHDRLYFGRLFRDCLDVLAGTFGYADRRLTVTANRV